MKISTRILGLLATAVIGLTLTSCGGGGGGGGGDSASSSENSGNSGSSGSGNGGNSSTPADIAPANINGLVFRGYGNEFYAFLSGATYSFGSSISDRYTGGGWSYRKTGPTTGVLTISNAKNVISNGPYFYATMYYSTDGEVNLTFSRSGNTTKVKMSGRSKHRSNTRDVTVIPHKETNKTSYATISGTFTVED